MNEGVEYDIVTIYSLQIQLQGPDRRLEVQVPWSLTLIEEDAGRGKRYFEMVLLGS
jgi:hypothetical protein